MASTIFHHWWDQYRALPERRRRWFAGAVVALAVVILLALGVLLGRGFGFSNGLKTEAQRLAARNVELAGQNQSLLQQQQTANATVAALKKTLTNRDAELARLKQEQAFYAKLIGGDGSRTGLGVNGIAVSEVKRTNAWNFTATLVNTAENADVARGTLSLAIEGVASGKLVTLDWAQVAGAAGKQGLPFAFKFFQQLQGSFVLPHGFVPNRLTVTLQPEGGAAIARQLDWSAALAGQHGITVTTP